MKTQSFSRFGALAALVVGAPAFPQRIALDHTNDDLQRRTMLQLPDRRFLDQVVKDFPKLDVVVRVPAGSEIPTQLEKFVVRDGLFAGKLLRISGEDEAAVAAAFALPVFHAEYKRPNSFLQPLFEIGPNNLDARRSHLVPEFEAEFPAIRGVGITVGLFDEGLVRGSHQEFVSGATGRVSAKTTRGLSRHSTHCAGTIAARGLRPQAIGMATEVLLSSYDWDNDTVVLDRDATTMQVSSHSYGPLSGWVPDYPMTGTWNWWGGVDDVEDARYGKYTDDCSRVDEVLTRHTHLVTCFAAGNDRGMGPDGQPVDHFVVTDRSFSNRIRDKTGAEHGLDCISGAGLAKNAICIGAINDVFVGSGMGAIQITSFSGVGPADDGRIKPDLVANGYQLLSTSNNSDTAYAALSGTSMATPTASGISAVLWELYKAKHDRSPTSAEIKASLIHTARDGGVVGPDPQYGWGSIDAHAAGLLVAGGAGMLVADPTVNVITPGGEAKEFLFGATGDPVRVTVVWIDPPAQPNGGGIDDATATLVNDLDLRVTAPNGTIYLPYSLDLSDIWDSASGTPNHARTDRPNRVDNVEMVDASSAAGSWKVEILGSPSVSQSFALAVSGLKQVSP